MATRDPLPGRGRLSLRIFAFLYTAPQGLSLSFETTGRIASRVWSPYGEPAIHCAVRSASLRVKLASSRPTSDCPGRAVAPGSSCFPVHALRLLPEPLPLPPSWGSLGSLRCNKPRLRDPVLADHLREQRRAGSHLKGGGRRVAALRTPGQLGNRPAALGRRAPQAAGPAMGARDGPVELAAVAQWLSLRCR